MTFDVAIAGGGPAGLALAIELAGDGASVAVLDRPARRHPRGETLPPGCRPLLARLGILAEFASGPHERCEGTMAAWGSAEVHVTDYLLHPERHGWHLDRAAFEWALAAEALRRGATILETNVHEVERTGHWSLDGGIKAHVLVDATGRSAAIARRRGARKLVDDQLVGLAAHFEIASDGARAYPLIEACEDGWLYSACAPGGGLVVMLMTDSDLAHARRLHDPATWLAAVLAQPHTAARIAGAKPPSELAIAPASSHRLSPIAGEAWLAVGDAATALDPLSSQGIVKALRSATEAATAIRTHAFADYAERAADEYA
ncbi:MAG TPA: FAD-dependent monooxygenase, partial [Thermoanaerobaculia bacterium]